MNRTLDSPFFYLDRVSLARHNILSRASEAGSPTNRPGSDKTRGQGSFGLSTGGFAFYTKTG